MIVATIITPRIGSGTDADPYRPRAMDDFPGLEYEDITGRDMRRAFGPNLYVIQVRVPDALAATIGGNSSYRVLWQKVLNEAGEEVSSTENNPLTPAQQSGLITWLTNRGIDAATAAQLATGTRRQVAQALIQLRRQT